MCGAPSASFFYFLLFPFTLPTPPFSYSYRLCSLPPPLSLPFCHSLPLSFRFVPIFLSSNLFSFSFSFYFFFIQSYSSFFPSPYPPRILPSYISILYNLPLPPFYSFPLQPLLPHIRNLSTPATLLLFNFHLLRPPSLPISPSSSIPHSLFPCFPAPFSSFSLFLILCLLQDLFFDLPGRTQGCHYSILCAVLWHL